MLRFFFTFLDVDQSKEGKIREQLHVQDFRSYYVSTHTEVSIGNSTDGGLDLRSTMFGPGCDNVLDPMNLGVVSCQGTRTDQRKRAVTFEFVDRWSFRVRGAKW